MRLGPWDQQVSRNVKSLAKLADHRHAEFALTIHDFAHAACRAEKRYEIRAGEVVLLHQISQQLRQARRPAGPARTLIARSSPSDSGTRRMQLIDLKTEIYVVPGRGAEIARR